MRKTIQYLGESITVACDERCSKAWGVNSRPQIQLSGDPDDYAWLTDEELETAPRDPGTYEGDDAKPQEKSDIPNKWCIRECERCVKDVTELPDFSQRIYNQPWKHNILEDV